MVDTHGIQSGSALNVKPDSLFLSDASDGSFRAMQFVLVTYRRPIQREEVLFWEHLGIRSSNLTGGVRPLPLGKTALHRTQHWPDWISQSNARGIASRYCQAGEAGH